MGITDVFVIGGGPAGLAAAIAARQRGFSVTVADGAKPPIDKPCGEGLMPDALAALRGLGVTLTHSDGCAFRGVRFLGSGYEVSAGFPSGVGRGLRRPVLHQRMIEQAERVGVTLLWKAPVTGISANAVRIAERTLSARYIIGADGMRSRVRCWSGLDGPSPRRRRFAFRAHYAIRPWTDHMELYWGPGGQAYVTPVSADDVCVVLTSRRPNFRHAAIAEQFPKLAARLRGAQMTLQRGEITMTHSFPRVYSDRIALIGDASGTVDAITGEGLCLSFQQANALADALSANDLRAYQRAHRRLSRRPALMGRLLLALDRSATVRRQTLRVFASHPSIFSRLAAAHIGANRRSPNTRDFVPDTWSMAVQSPRLGDATGNGLGEQM